ncbi:MULTISPECIES: porin [Rhizobium]|uniref:Porin n=1 Tax=Rhizobium rhododendri TaxID=2506430 RepID=A0ABY8IPY9_9HYPH|nr:MULTISPECIES: porin [Rhizobium]MBO9101548.1 porin [Rhizobium sp. L58/93]MBO9134791.1 porin [Rhizobium sp. B209b/85]MBO9170528.1 porin [Rhizobium sp. L245/93]MBO9187541.1 porin [Rhizobium sp. E27B/91]MBZ5761342.1 porin [Rhizobium sp. VS19-DR96]
MMIKGLLLASAAALSAFSAANAADAIVAAEPEPLEYVRICDAYGAGYFYIPGTETCLKIGGMVRTEGEWKDAYQPDHKIGTLWHTRAELSLDTASDTEYGALKTDMVMRWDSQEGDNSTKLLFANISLGGFLVGKADSQFSSYPGYAGDIIQDDVVSYGPGPTNTELNQLTYTFDPGNGFTALASIEDSNSSGDTYYDSSFTQSNGKSWQISKNDQYVPDGVLGFGFKSGAWGIKVVGGYDSIVKEGAIKARVDADFGTFSAFLMGGWNTDGDKLNKYASGYVTDGACPANKEELCGWGDWAVWGGGSATINDKLKANVQVAYTDSKIFAAAANVKFQPVKGLTVEPEVEYTNWDSTNEHSWAGILRFQRSF